MSVAALINKHATTGKEAWSTLSLAYDSLAVPLIEILANCVSKMNFCSCKEFYSKALAAYRIY